MVILGNNFGSVIAFIGLMIACYMLYLEKKVIKNSSEFDTYSTRARTLEFEINRYEKMIDNMRARSENYSHLAKKINHKLIPELKEVYQKMTAISEKSGHPVTFDSDMD